jgi:hypothetical protein
MTRAHPPFMLEGPTATTSTACIRDRVIQATRSAILKYTESIKFSIEKRKYITFGLYSLSGSIMQDTIPENRQKSPAPGAREIQRSQW